jgi:hypothetical protein
LQISQIHLIVMSVEVICNFEGKGPSAQPHI